MGAVSCGPLQSEVHMAMTSLWLSPDSHTPIMAAALAGWMSTRCCPMKWPENTVPREAASMVTRPIFAAGLQ